VYTVLTNGETTTEAPLPPVLQVKLVATEAVRVVELPAQIECELVVGITKFAFTDTASKKFPTPELTL
jgi:hypothetical protein